MKKIFLTPLFLLIAIASLQATPFDFTDVADKATDAVVTIKVEAPRQTASSPFMEERDSDDPFDRFSRRFFKQFFERSPRSAPSRPQGPVAAGTGFIISKDGYVITNNHVIQQSSEITVKLNDNKELKAKIIGVDPHTDLAVLKVEETNLPFVSFGNSDNLKVGQWVIAIGNPFGLQSTLTVGVVSAKGRTGLDLTQIEDFIQTDAAINRGNSGGPLLNLQGEVVGINTAMVGRGGFQQTGIGFAIPSNLAKAVASQLIETGEVSRGFMGVLLQSVDQDLAESFGLDRPQGALIAEVTPGSPAEKAGIKQGDLILSYNNIEVKNVPQLKSAIASLPPGSNVLLKVKRDKEIKTLSIELSRFPDAVAAVEESPVAGKLGLHVENITPATEQSFGFQPGSGVVVSQVDQGSIAEWAGIRKGTLIMSVNRQKVETVESFHQAIEQTPQGSPILFLIRQGGQTRFVSLRVG